MSYAIEIHGRLAQERIEREIASGRSASPHAPRSDPSSIRRAIGHRFIRIGARIASEPSLELGPVPVRTGPAPQCWRSSDDHRRP